MKYIYRALITISFLLLLLISFSSLVHLYENRTKIKSFFQVFLRLTQNMFQKMMIYIGLMKL